MAIESYFFNALQTGDAYDRTYSAEDFTNYLKLLVGNGVFPNPSTQLQVRASSGMQVIVGAGSGWIDGHKMDNTSDLILTIESSDVLLDRIDRVIFYVDYSTRNMGIDVLKGTLSTSPVAPTLTRNETRYEMSLATVRIGKQTNAITNSVITDTRMDSDVCGMVQGLIQQADTSTLFKQWDEGFNAWFNDVKETLSTTTLIRKYEGTYITTVENEFEFNVQTHVPNYNSNLDILEVYIANVRLNVSDYSINGTNVTLVHALDVVGTEVTFVVYKSIDGSEAESVVELVDALMLRVNELESKKAKSATVTLPSSGWVASGDVYTQTVGISIVTSVNDVIIVSPVENVPVRATAQGVGSLTFTAYEKLTNDVVVNVVNVGV